MRGCITKKGSTYSIIVDIGRDSSGKRRQKWFNGFKTKKEAEKELAKVINQIETNSFVNPEKITLAEFMKQWYDDIVVTNLTPTTIELYRYIMESHITPSLGGISIQKLQPMQIQHFYKQLQDNGRKDGKGGLSPKSILNVHRTLKRALGHAVKMQLINRNPAEFVEVPKQKKYRAAFLNEEQVQELLQTFKDTNIYIAVLLAVGIGLRRGEALGLQWKDIDFDNKMISINRTLLVIANKVFFHDPKTEKSKRVIAVPETIIEELKAHREKQDEFRSILGQAYKDDDLVTCYNDGSPINPATFSNMFLTSIRKSNLPQIRFHDLRHTNATLMLKHNIPAKVASERLGHSTIGITLDLYSHVMKEMQEEAAQKLDNALFARE